MKQFVGAVEGVAGPKLLAKNLLDVRTPQDMGIAVKPVQERSLLIPGQFGRLACLLEGANSLQAVVSIEVDPPLDEVLASSELVHDLSGGLAFQGQQDGSPSISLLGVGLLPNPPAQFVEVRQVMRCDVHWASFPWLLESMRQDARERNPNMCLTAHENYLRCV
jgi:hypothetical protein